MRRWRLYYETWLSDDVHLRERVLRAPQFVEQGFRAVFQLCWSFDDSSLIINTSWGRCRMNFIVVVMFTIRFCIYVRVYLLIFFFHIYPACPMTSITFRLFVNSTKIYFLSGRIWSDVESLGQYSKLKYWKSRHSLVESNAIALHISMTGMVDT